MQGLEKVTDGLLRELEGKGINPTIVAEAVRIYGMLAEEEGISYSLSSRAARYMAEKFPSEITISRGYFDVDALDIEEYFRHVWIVTKGDAIVDFSPSRFNISLLKENQFCRGVAVVFPSDAHYRRYVADPTDY